MWIHFAAVATALSAVLAVFGAGLGPDPGRVDLAAADAHVHVRDFAFVPGDVEVTPGSTVAWDNHDSTPHTVTGTGFDSGSLAEGDAFAFTFESEGTFAYACDFHPSMRGTVIVRAPNVPPTVTVTEPAPGATVRDVVNVTGVAEDADGTIERVEVSVDGGPFAPANGTGEWRFELDTVGLENGEHAVTVRATDDRNGTAEATVTFVVDNPRLPDLVAVALTATGGPTRQSLTATLENAGIAPAGPFAVTFRYAYKGELHAIDAPTLPGLGAGETITVTVQWDTLGKVGAFPILVTADDTGLVQEARERNNEAASRAVIVANVPGTDALDP